MVITVKRPEDKKLHLIAKMIMTAIFLWSGFFWSGATIINFYMLKPEYSHLSPQFLAGSLVTLLALILCWLRFYILQIFPCAIGLILYLRPVKEMMDHVAGRGVYFKPTFEQRYLPMIGFAILSVALFIIRLWQIFSAKAERRSEFDNSPAESILEKRRDE